MVDGHDGGLPGLPISQPWELAVILPSPSARLAGLGPQDRTAATPASY
jgi:hypothetical protein